jgi:hypothetical protein
MDFLKNKLPISKSFFLVIVAIFLASYFYGFKTPFLMDDSHAIQTNQFVHSLEHFAFPWVSAKATSSAPDNYGYRPVTVNFFQVMWFAGNGSTLAFEIGKKIIFLLLAWIVFLLWREWQMCTVRKIASSLWWGSGFAFAFFLLHPSGVQVANYIGASTTLLCAFFYFLAFYFYLKFRRLGGLHFLIFGALSYFLSVMSKEEGITLIGILFVAELFYFRKSQILNLKNRIPAFLVYLLMAAASVFLIYIHFEPSSDIARGSVPRMLYFATQWKAYLFYLSRYFWPVGYNFDNLEFGFAQELWTVANIIYLSINVALLSWGAYLCFRKNSIGIAILGFYISILPASSIIVLAEPVNDHRDFIPFFFLSFGIILGLEKLVPMIIKNTRNEMIFASVLILALAGVTFDRNMDFASSKTLWLDTLLKNPHSPRAKNNLSLDYMAVGNYEVANALLTKCHEEAPTYEVCLINLAILSGTMGHSAKADEYFLKAIAFDQAGVEARFYYSTYLISMGRLKEALTLLEESNRLAGGLHRPVSDALKNLKTRLNNQAQK